MYKFIIDLVYLKLLVIFARYYSNVQNTMYQSFSLKVYFRKFIQNVATHESAYLLCALWSASNANIDFSKSDKKKIVILCKLFSTIRSFHSFLTNDAIFRLYLNALGKVQYFLTYNECIRESVLF